MGGNDLSKRITGPVTNITGHNINVVLLPEGLKKEIPTDYEVRHIKKNTSVKIKGHKITMILYPGLIIEDFFCLSHALDVKIPNGSVEINNMYFKGH